jgi:hypothetical protein
MTPIDLFGLRRERRDGILAAGIGRSNGSSENLRRLFRLFWLIAAGVSLLVIAFLQLRSGQLWSDPRYTKPNSLLGRIIDGLLVRAFHVVNKCRPWHKIGKWPGVANLLALRIELRRYNLFDTDADLTQPKKDNGKVCPFATGPNATRKRNEDGSLNDLSYPAMGCRFTRLGRNMQTKVPIDEELDLKWPNPYEISEKLLQRTDFKPAMGLNLLAAAWIQFQVHDWFSHENEELTPNDSDPANEGKKIELQDENGVRRMILPKTKPDLTNWPDRNEWPPNGRRPPLNSRYPAYRNKDPQWWDASQIYGETVAETLHLRTDPQTGDLMPGGKLYLDANLLLPLNPKTGFALSGFTDNWWLGLELLHTLFAQEHNRICDELRKHENHLTDQEIFETTRLIICALMAKIHSVEWTPGILGHPSIQPALDANWMGLIGHFLGEEKSRRVAARLPPGVVKDVLTGIPMSETDHHGAPYSLTEEFNTVYRLHPLIPDEVVVERSGENGGAKTYQMIDIAFKKARSPFEEGASMTEVIYSFGTSHPGAIVPQNYPNFLRSLELPPDISDGPSHGRIQKLDLAATDIIRDRERGVPRYCEFRRQLRMPVPSSWEELAGCRQDLAGELKRIYRDDLEAVDTIVGMFFENVPDKFGFSDTAFRIFILMASRRMKSDRFFTEDYTEEFYTRTGLDWIARTGMKEVILRHHPSLQSAFAKGQNPFAPWLPLNAPLP